ncbi:retrovirus-related pol polyprotein from transposon TNT 1-94 [Tanacetum coccineum]
MEATREKRHVFVYNCKGRSYCQSSVLSPSGKADLPEPYQTISGQSSNTTMLLIQADDWMPRYLIVMNSTQPRLLLIGESVSFRTCSRCNSHETARESKPKQYDGNTILKNDTIVDFPDSDETLSFVKRVVQKMHFERTRSYLTLVPALDPSHSSTTVIVEVPKELPKVSMVNTSLKELKRYLTGFDQVVKERTTATAITEGMWGSYLQAKGPVIVKLKEQIKSSKRNVENSTVKMDMDEIETLNIELEHRVTKLVTENEHLKQTYKQLYDSIKPKHVQSKEQCDALIQQVNKSSGREFLNFKCKTSRTRKTLSVAYGSMWANAVAVSWKEVHPRYLDDYSRFTGKNTLREYYEKVGISHETSVARSPQKNGIVERRNRTLIEAARTMLIYAKAPLFLWAEAVATACYTQNRSMICRHHGKTPYELLHDKPPDLSYLHVFSALCYLTNDSDNLGKLQPKADIGIFIGYAPTKKAFWIYNRCTKRIIETIHVDFDELTAMASEHSSSKPALHDMTPVTISSGLMPNPPPSTPFVPPSRSDWDLLFQPMFDESLNPPPYDKSLNWFTFLNYS